MLARLGKDGVLGGKLESEAILPMLVRKNEGQVKDYRR